MAIADLGACHCTPWLSRKPVRSTLGVHTRAPILLKAVHHQGPGQGATCGVVVVVYTRPDMEAAERYNLGAAKVRASARVRPPHRHAHIAVLHPHALQAWYLICCASSSLVIPFLSIYFSQLGFSSRQIGALFAVRPWLTALTGARQPDIHISALLTGAAASSRFGLAGHVWAA